MKIRKHCLIAVTPHDPENPISHRIRSLGLIKNSLIIPLSITLAASAMSVSAETFMAGWDFFDSAITPTATQVAADTTATLVTSATGGTWGRWNGGTNNDAGASTDGTFGSLSTTVAAASTAGGANANLSLNRSAKPGSITITLTNNSTVDRLLDGFYFDAVGRLSQSAKQWTLTFGGAISGTAASGTLTQADMMAATPEQRDWAVDLTGLADNKWEAGSDAIFILTFSGGATSTGTGGGQETLVDNIGITASPTVPAPPALVSTDPADGATNIGPSQILTATFDEPIFLNTTGSITIKNLTTLSDTIISLPGPDPDGTLSVSGNQLTINPTDNLGAAGDEIAIEISADAIKDADDEFYPGLLATDDPNWSFTIDNIPPAPVYFHPIPSSDQAPLDGALFIAFDEAPQIGTGNIGIYRVSDDSLVENIDVTSVTQNGARIAITPTVLLAYDTSYYVLIDSGAFTDALGNEYGITDPAVWTFTTISNDPTVLFGDSFNRPNDTDLNASAGKYGSLGALTYTPVLIGVASVQLSDGQLLLESNESAGTSGPLVYPNHNFVDAAIESAGGFSITVDLNANLSGGSGRYLSVAVGRTSADIDGQTSATAAGNAATADLVVALRNNDTLWIYENGTNVTGTNGLSNAPATPTKMRIDYSLADFNLGSTVNYEVFFGDSETAFTSGTFTWTGTDENYISLSSNLTLTAAVGERHAMLDNLQIRTLGSGGGSGFDTWQTANNTAGGLDDDHDGDGVSNGIEFFIYGPVASSGFTALPGVANDAGTLSVTFTKAADYTGVYGTDYEVQVSSTLASWGPAPGGSVTFPSATEVKYTFPDGTKNFARLQVTGP